MSKYAAKKTTVHGITFDSKAESRRYLELLMLQRAGQIKSIELQPKFEIIPAYKHPVTGKRVRATHYIADFKVEWADGNVTVEDVKSQPTMTPLYRLKKKLVEREYGIEIKEVMG